jgi:hypothetical protein
MNPEFIGKKRPLDRFFESLFQNQPDFETGSIDNFFYQLFFRNSLPYMENTANSAYKIIQNKKYNP